MKPISPPLRSRSAFIAFATLAWITGTSTLARADTGPAQIARSACIDHVNEAAAISGLPRAWIVEVMRAESGGRARAVSPAGAMGCMQIMPATWAELTRRYALGSDPFDPRANTLSGALYLRVMHDRFGWPGALAAYHAGPGRYGAHVAGVRLLPAPTRQYVARVTGQLAESAQPVAFVTAEIRRSDWRRSGLFMSADVQVVGQNDDVGRDRQTDQRSTVSAEILVARQPEPPTTSAVQDTEIDAVHPLFAGSRR